MFNKKVITKSIVKKLLASEEGLVDYSLDDVKSYKKVMLISLLA